MNDDIEEISPEMYRSAQKNYMNTKEGFLSNLSKSFKNRFNEIGSLGKESKELPYPGSFGGQLGQLLGGTAADLPAMASASALGPAGIPLLGLYGYITSPGETSAEKAQQALMMGAPLAAGKAIPRLKGKFNKIGNNFTKPEGISSLQEMIEKLQKPGKVQEKIDALKEDITGTNLAKQQKVDTFLSEVEPAYAKKEEQVHNLEEDIENKLGEPSQEGIRGNVLNEVKNLETKINEQNKTNYDKFESEYGEQPVKNPIDFKTIDRIYGISPSVLKRYPDIKPLIERLRPKDTVSSLLGQSNKVEHYIGDYLNLYRALRDTVTENRKQARRAIGAEKNTLESDAKSLARLRNDVQAKKVESLDESGKKVLSNAQEYYKNYVAGLREHNPTQSILQEGKVPNNYFDTLNQPGMELIRDELLKNPQSRSILGLHSNLGMNFGQMTPRKILDLLKTDKAKLLDQDTQNMLAEYAGHKHDLSYLKKLKTEATKARIKEPDMVMKAILEDNPSLLKPFKDLKDMQSRMRNLQQDLIKMGLEKKEADAAASKYWKIVSAAKTIKSIKSGVSKIFNF